MKRNRYCFITLLLLAVSCTTKPLPEETKTNTPLIQPPIAGADIPSETYVISAEKGDMIFYKSGSIVSFPPNAFVDANGKIVSGDVKVTYREFSDPVDFFVSGIPMTYDSANTSYSFESSGMCEILASKDGVPLYVNQKSKPEINLMTGNSDEAHNLYYLDTVQKKWINKGKSSVNVMSNPTEEKIEPTPAKEPLTEVLPKPQKASGQRPAFSVEIDPASVPELKPYNNLEFEIDESEKNYNPNDAKTEWEDVAVVKGNKKGTYIVTFTKGKRKVSYVTHPVFEENNYAEARKVFEQKTKEANQGVLKANHDRALQAKADKIKKEEIANHNLQVSKKNEHIMKLNAITDSVNRITLAHNKQMLDGTTKNERIGRIMWFLYQDTNHPQLSLFDKNEVDEARTLVTEQRRVNEVMRTFKIEGFGIWNCDNPLLRQGVKLMASFKDKNGKKLDLGLVAVVCKELNGVASYNSKDRIQLAIDKECMILANLNNKLIYLPYEDFKKCSINAETKEYTFTMKESDEIIRTSEDVKKVIGL